MSLELDHDALTDIDESTRSSATKLLALEAEGDLDHAWDVSGRGLNSNGMRGDELTPNQHGAKDDLKTVKEVVADDDDGGTTRGPAF